MKQCLEKEFCQWENNLIGVMRQFYEKLQFNEKISLELQETMDVDVKQEFYAEPSFVACQDIVKIETRSLRSAGQSQAATYATTSSHRSISLHDAEFQFAACLRVLQIPPMENGLSNTQRNAEFKGKCLDVIEKVKQIMECLFPGSSKVIANGKCDDCAELTNDLTKKYVESRNKKERFQVATCLPRNLSIQKVMSVLNVSIDIAKKISKLRNEQGAFSFIEPKYRQMVSKSTIEKVKEYYLSPLYSKILPGQYDTVFSDKDVDGKKERVAKQLMLITLTELHAEFIQQNPHNPISLSEFSKNRPRQCRWVWNKGHHRNCTCIVHENFKLLLQSTCSSKVGSKTEKIIGELLCEDAQINCWLGFV